MDNEMTNEERIEKLKALRAPFPAHQISKLPKPYKRDSQKGHCPECGGWHGLPAAHLDYVGHAAITARLLDVDPFYNYEPYAVDARGLPVVDEYGGMWMKLTVCGVTRLGYGDATNQQNGSAVKERIGDCLRNAGMRFGMALELWHKGELYLDDDQAPAGQVREPEQQAPEPIGADELEQIAVSLASAPDESSLRSLWQSFYVRATEVQRGYLEPIKNARKDALIAAAVGMASDLAEPGAPAQPMGTHPPQARTRSLRSVAPKPRNTTH
jgi:hypothetical protein